MPCDQFGWDGGLLALAPKSQLYGINQLCLRNGLGEIRRYSERAAAGRIASLSSRCQHQDGGVCDRLPLPDLFGQSEPVYFRHMAIEQSQPKGMVCFGHSL